MNRIIQNVSGTLLSLAITVWAAGHSAAGSGCTPPPAGIVSWWPGEGNGNDLVGGNNASLAPGVRFGPGMVGQGFYLNATNAYAVVPASPSLNIGTNQTGLTLEAWIDPTNVTGFHPIFQWGQLSAHGNLGVQLWLGSQLSDVGVLSGTMVGIDGTLYPVVSAQNAIVPNQFQHVALTYDPASSNEVLYVNGTVVAQQHIGPVVPQTSYDLCFGRRLSDMPGDVTYGAALGGILDEPSIYSRALSAAEIQAIYNAGSAGKCVGNPSGSNGVPVISRFSPTSGSLGMSLTLAGTNFSPVAASNIVYFGAVQATVSAASVSSLTVAVPAGAMFGPITVTVGGLTAYSGAFFEPTFRGLSTNFTGSSFAPYFNLPANGAPGGTAIGDLDGDGKPDLVLINNTGNSLWIYRNIGTNSTLSPASFDTPVVLPLAGNISGVALADLDGDGRLDIVVTDNQNNNVSVFQNFCTPGIIATNSFGTRVDFAVGQQPNEVAVTDLNGDGHPDLVTVNYTDSTLSVLANTGSPGGITSNTFAPHIDFPTGAGPYGLAVGDLDGDGKPDIAVINADVNIVSVFQNLGGGALTTNSFAPRVDLATPSNGNGVAIGDVDGDGKPDLLVTGYDGQTLSLFQNIGGPGTITTNSFGPRIDFATGGHTHRVALTDLDGDGRPDVIVTTELPDQLLIYKNLSSPGTLTNSSLAAPVNLSAGWNPDTISIADLDGDGRPDIFVSVTWGDFASVYQNNVPFNAAPSAPSISAQPTNLTVTVYGTAVFSVAATGTPPLNYQWNFNGTNLSGATGPTLTLTNVLPAQAGNYSVLVSNVAGSILSSNAALTVYVPPVPPSILSQTPSQVVLLGSPAIFSVTAGGAIPLSYFWSRNGTLIPNATNSFYELAGAQLSDSGSKFSCLVTNAYGSASSTNAALKVIDTISNDLCSGAVVITSYSYTNAQSTANASSCDDPVPDCVDGFGNGVWYQFTAPAAGRLYVDTFGSDFDTGLAAYTGTCDSLTEIVCNDDAGGGVTSQVILPTTAGTTYYFLAGGYGGHVGNLVIHLNYLAPPNFDVQPTNLFVVVSSNAIFSPVVSGTSPIAFQWYFDNTPLVDGGRISGSTNSTLTIANVQTNDVGNYQLVASNVVGVTTSSVAVLTPVILPPAFVQLPASQSVGIGSNVNFFAVVGGTPPYSYQWYLNGTPLVDDGVHVTGSATSSLSVSNLTTADAGSYSLTVTNLVGSTNAAATLTVLTPPVITLQPIGRSVPQGLPTIFTAAASGIPAPAYQWQLNGANLPGATGASYTNPAVGISNLGSYQLVASNVMGVVVSSNAQLTFGPVAAWGRNLNNECLPPPDLIDVAGVAGTYQASFAVLANGTIAAWGNGAQTTIPGNATNVVALATDDNTGFAALRADGTVASWGNLAPALSNVVSVALGSNSGFALRAEGTVTGWGNQIAPIPAGLNHVTAIAAGYVDALALRNDGTLVAWGAGSATNIPAGLANVIAIAAGPNCNLALKSNGTVVAWGIGSGTYLPPGLTNVVAISASSYVQTPNLCLALRNDGTVVTWGDNAYGQTNPPPALNSLDSVAIAAAPGHGLALVNEDDRPQILQGPVGLTTYAGRNVTLQATVANAGTLVYGPGALRYQWLFNGASIPGATNTSLTITNIQLANAGSYQLSVGELNNTALSLPAPVTVISNNALTFLSQTSASATNVYQGGKITFYGGAVLGNGPLSCQWFFAPANQNYLPVPGATNDTLTLDPALALQSGNYYLAISNQVGGVTSAPVAVRVMFAKAWGYLAADAPFILTNATAIAVGNYGTYTTAGDYLALSSAGKISSWSGGPVNYGETNFSALSNSIVTAIAAGYEDTLALKSDGSVFALGYFGYGVTNVPVSANGIVAIACGDYHDLALRWDGTVVGWGQNTYGQTTNGAATNVVAIAAGGQDSIALRADGSVTTWGSYGAVGLGNYPVPSSATNVIAVAAGGMHFLALRANGTVTGWGNNGYGQTTIPASWTNIVAISAGGNHSTALRNDGTVMAIGTTVAGLFTNYVPADLANVVAIASSADRDLGLFGTRAPAFTVQPWNRTVFNTVTSVWFSAKCAGVQPVTYQWQLNGTNIPGATNDMLTINSQRPPQGGPVPPLSPGIYQLLASNAYGVAASKYAQLNVLIPLGVALNATNLNWTTAGDVPWYGEANVTYDGVAAAQSGSVGMTQDSILQTTVATNVPGAYTFWWMVSSEPNFDFLEFRINGIVQTSISGSTGWQQVSIPVPPGTNVLMWRYSDESIFGSGLNAGWVDQFAFVAAPQIIRQPTNVVADQGTTIYLSVQTTDSPTLGYQWQQNGNRVGGNSSTLTLGNVCRAQNGTYFVTVTNAGGTAVSSNAAVHINVRQLLGTPALLPNGTFQLTSSDVGGGTLSPSDLPNFTAQASSDLVTWVSLPNALSLTNGVLLLQDNAGTNGPARFYRIVEQ